MRSKPFAVTAFGLAFAMTAPLLAATLGPGKYTSTLTPPVNKQTANKIEKQLDQIQEIKSIDVKQKDSSLHFTVKDNANVDRERITDAVKAASPETTASEPMAETITPPSAEGTSGTSTGGY